MKAVTDTGTVTGTDATTTTSVELQRAIEALWQATDAMRSSGTEIAGAAGSYVRSNPMKSVGAAAAAGLLLGLLLARR